MWTTSLDRILRINNLGHQKRIFTSRSNHASEKMSQLIIQLSIPCTPKQYRIVLWIFWSWLGLDKFIEERTSLKIGYINNHGAILQNCTLLLIYDISLEEQSVFNNKTGLLFYWFDNESLEESYFLVWYQRVSLSPNSLSGSQPLT